MKKQKLLELSKRGTDFEFVIPAGTTVENIEYILRGYENLNDKLNNLGAEIYLIKS